MNNMFSLHRLKSYIPIGFCVLLMFFVCSQSLITESEKLLTPYFEFEGNNPYCTDNTLCFSALESKYLSTNGHGFRNEMKKRKELRKSLYQTKEIFSASVKANLSSGSKTIVVQYHDDLQSTIVKLYIADIYKQKLLNGVANDGIFDVFVMIKEPDGNEKTFSMIAIKSNDSFDLELENKNGNISIHINDIKIQDKAIDCNNVYLKFGNYLQAQDSVSSKQVEDKNKYADFYKANNITEDKIIFSNIIYKSF